ncbi:aldehyde dehydrogenase (NADP(+)) [Verrucomicrobiota bacterium sgz303538]
MTSSLHGKSFVAGVLFEPAGRSFRAVSPLDSQQLDPEFHDATSEAVDQALTAAEEAFVTYRRTTPEQRAQFLERIADEIVALGDGLLERAHRETGLPLDRLTGERGRTVGQLRLFADLVREGSWIDARIDTALPDRKPVPKPDLRRMLIPLGPVIVFGASNFPLAFSVAGGDTASALAAGNPVVVKGHPAHPGTSELVATAITRAIEACGLPTGVFSMLHGNGPEVGAALVRHPLARAVGFTGSRKAGRALFDAAAARPEPIPVFAEMSSVNPIFVLPGALRERKAQIAEGLKNSITMGVGQFCTKPGLVFALGGEDLQGFAQALTEGIRKAAPATMLHSGICNSFSQGVDKLRETSGVVVLASADADADTAKTHGAAVVFATDTENFARNPELHEELFGPATLIVDAQKPQDLLEIARRMEGQLTATLHGTPEDLANAAELISILERKAGRLLVNGFPTGVEVCPSMHHGGPYPATTDERFTSVGTAAILRFARPVCYQSFPASALPPELQDNNPRGIMRLVNGKLTRDEVTA